MKDVLGHGRNAGAFSDKWIPEPTSGCWLWLGGHQTNGYGLCRKTTAHRVSWLIHRGPIPNGLYVLHRCDVRSCVNPDHLFVGTQAENLADMLRKGRCRTRIGDAAILEARRDHAAGVGVRELARRHGVTATTMSRILAGKSRKVCA